MNGLLLLAAAAVTAPVPPPIAQWSADCERPSYAVDQLVCGDPALTALDRQLADLLRRVAADRLRRPWIEDHEAWFRRSRLCAFQKEERVCTKEAYEERIAVLSTFVEQPPVMTMECHARGQRFGAGISGATLSLTAGTDFLGVAVSAGSRWAPFLSFSRRGSDVTLRDVHRSVVATCRTSSR